MRFHSKKKCNKQYKKLSKDVKNKFGDCVDLMRENPRHPLLGIHKLKGDKKPLRSIKVTGDYRAIFLQEGDSITFHEIGTHSELYS